VHDVAGHGLAAIAMQAGIALITFDDDPEQARASLEAIRHTSTTALAQLRTALDRLDPRHHGNLPGQAPPGPPDPLFRPAEPGEPHDLAGLVDGVRAAGLAVDVLPPDPVIPAHLRGTVYRVVRESLTNVLRHAGPTSAEVRLTHEPRSFVLKIADQGRTRPNVTERHGGHATGEVSRPSAGEGRGLAGMRAAVTEAGGHFSAGPRDGGGFQVVAGFPTDHRSAVHVPADRSPQEQA
jgi:signal transduction histidine kinase